MRLTFGMAGALTMVAAASAQTQGTPAGRWLAEDIKGGGVIDNLQTTLDIGAHGEVGGFGGCNHFRGRASLEGASVTFGPLAATRKACTPAVMDQEQKFFAALDIVRGWRMEGGKLVLLTAAGKPAVIFSRLER